MSMLSTTKTAQIAEQIANIEDAVVCAGYSMRFATQDQLDKQFYNSDDIIGSYIKGSACMYQMPRGFISYSKKNQYRMDCANIYFMVKNNFIPVAKTNLPDLCNVLRSDGRKQRARVSWNNSLVYNTKHDYYMVSVDFYNAETNTTTPTKFDNTTTDEEANIDTTSDEYLYHSKNTIHWGDMSKGMKLTEFMTLNETEKLIIKLDSLQYDNYKQNDETKHDVIKSEIIQYYNNLMKKWIFETLSKKMIEYRILCEIYLDGKKVFTSRII